MDGTTLWWQSKTIWASIVALLAGALTLAGINLDAALQSQLVELISGLGSLVAGAVAWYGRAKATTTISPNLVKK
jgi:hypothetical protein